MPSGESRSRSPLRPLEKMMKLEPPITFTPAVVAVVTVLGAAIREEQRAILQNCMDAFRTFVAEPRRCWQFAAIIFQRPLLRLRRCAGQNRDSVSRFFSVAPLSRANPPQAGRHRESVH